MNLLEIGERQMKKISITIPCYNEEENVYPLHDALVEMFERDLPNYEYDCFILIIVHQIELENF